MTAGKDEHSGTNILEVDNDDDDELDEEQLIEEFTKYCDENLLFDDDSSEEMDEQAKRVQQQIRDSMPKTHLHSVKKPIQE